MPRPQLFQQEELVLLVSLTLLSCASFQSIYKEKFGLPGDWIFVGLTTFWLSRYALTRWICTWDCSTSATPTLRGVLAHFITSHITAGQYFDRPSPAVLARQGIGATRPDEDGRTAVLSTFVLPSILAAWNWIRVRLLIPLLRVREACQKKDSANSSAGAGTEQTTMASSSSHHSHATPNHPSSSSSSSKRTKSNDNANNMHSSSSASSHRHPWIQKGLQTATKLYQASIPALQISIPACTLIYYTWRLPFARYLLPASNPYRYDTTASSEASVSEPPQSWSEVLFVASFPTVASLLVFSRLLNPIPDLVAGSNVLKAVRNEAKSQGTVGSSKSSKSKAASKAAEEGIPWAEQNKSIVAQNRLRLICTVAVLRIVENLFVAVILPWTGYACRATGHCQEGIQLWQLSTVLFPVGITSALRPDAATVDQDVQADYFAAVLIAFSVIMVSILLLVAQAVTTNGSYLAITGFLCGEWVPVDQPTTTASKSAAPSQWDPKRRYKKGDIIVVHRSFWIPPRRQVYYKATSNSPEGRPLDLFLRVTHDLFRNELGHPSTSKLLAMAIYSHLIFIAILMAIVVLDALFWGTTNNGKVYALAANIVACYGATRAGLTNRSELRQLSEGMK